jgi:rubrerythrin
MREGDAGKREQLRETSSVLEVIDVAIQFEEAAAAFYQQLIPRVSKPLRWLVSTLAEEEEEHAARLREMHKRPDLQQLLERHLQQLRIDPRFSDALQTPDLEAVRDEQALLEYALSREQLALEQYRQLAQESLPGPLRELFQWLANEEIDHKGELEKRYYALVYRGGGV